MKFDGNKLLLEYGSVEIMELSGMVVCAACYVRNDLEYYRSRNFENLEDGYKWYLKLEKNMRGA